MKKRGVFVFLRKTVEIEDYHLCTWTAVHKFKKEQKAKLGSCISWHDTKKNTFVEQEAGSPNGSGLRRQSAYQRHWVIWDGLRTSVTKCTATFPCQVKSIWSSKWKYKHITYILSNKSRNCFSYWHPSLLSSQAARLTPMVIGMHLSHFPCYFLFSRVAGKHGYSLHLNVLVCWAHKLKFTHNGQLKMHTTAVI